MTNSFNQLGCVSRRRAFAAAGLVQSATNVAVTVNGSGATVYTDKSFARSGITLSNGSNTFTAVATDSTGRTATNSVTAWLPTTTGFTYDRNGNLTSDGRRGFAYDDADQLTSVTVTNAWRSEFKYDALGRRRVRLEKVWKNSQWVTASETRYVYDHMLVIQERDGLNLPTATYTRGLDLSGGLQRAGGIGGLLALTQPSPVNPQHFYYHADAGGNVTALTDSRQAVAARYRYDPFGNLLGLSGPMAESNLYRFSSKEFHANSGLYYYGYRFYEPSLQRWLNRDPIGEVGGINLYGFVRNRPTYKWDSFGFQDEPLTAADWMDSEECEDVYQPNFKENFDGLTGTIKSTACAIGEALPPGNAWVAVTGKGLDDKEVSGCKRGVAMTAMATGPTFKFLSKLKGFPCWLRKLLGIGDDAASGAASIVGKGIRDPSGAIWRMGRFDPKTGLTVFDDLGHFGNGVKGLTLFEKEGRVFWANDSVSSHVPLTASEVLAVASALAKAFPSSTITQVKKLSDAFGQ